MRELAKSLMRFSWALSVLGADQLRRGLEPDDGPNRVRQSLDRVSDLAEDELTEPMRGFYKFGRRMQSQTVDTVSKGTRIFEPFLDRAADLLRGRRDKET